MKDEELLQRLPYHAEPNVVPPFQLKRVMEFGRVLGVITNGEEGINLYPGPNAGQPFFERELRK